MAKKIIPEVISIEEIYNIGKLIKDPKDVTLFYFLYLSGARISEALKVKKEDIKLVDDKALVFLITLKNKKQNFREVPIYVPNIYSKEERNMYLTLKKYASYYPPKTKLWNRERTNIWHRFSRFTFTTRGYKEKEIIEDVLFRMRPHYLRHARLTHLVSYYKFGIVELMKFAGWSKPDPAMIYVQLAGRELAEKMDRRL